MSNLCPLVVTRHDERLGFLSLILELIRGFSRVFWGLRSRRDCSLKRERDNAPVENSWLIGNSCSSDCVVFLRKSADILTEDGLESSPEGFQALENFAWR